MKKCEYCGGNAESGCGAVETAAGLYLHYSKIECAERLKIDLEHAKVDRDSCCAGTEVLRKKLEAALLQIRELEKAAEGGLRITCDNAYHDRGHGVCSFCVQKRIDEAIKTERQRCACVALSVWSAVPEDHMAWKRCQNAIHLKIRAADDVVEKPKSEFEDRTLCYKVLDKGLRCTLPSGHDGGCGFILEKRIEQSPKEWAICGWCAGGQDDPSGTCPKCGGAKGKWIEK